jgi:hypothetical protein
MSANQQQAVPRLQNTGYAQQASYGQDNANCYFCGMAQHKMCMCAMLEEYKCNSKVSMDPQTGRVRLPSGVDIPRNLPGKTLSEKIDLYHHSNTGQCGPNDDPPPPGDTTSTNFFGAPEDFGFSAQYLFTEAESYAGDLRIEEREDVDTDPVLHQYHQELSYLKESDPRISAYELAIDERRRALADGLPKGQRTSTRENKGKQGVRFADEQHDGAANQDIRNRPPPQCFPSEELPREVSPLPVPLRQPRVPLAPVSAALPMITPASQPPGPRPAFQPKIFTRGAPIIPQNIPRGTAPAQVKRRAPIEDGAHMGQILERSLDAPITISGRKLLGLSYDARQRMTGMLSAKQVDNQQHAAVNFGSGVPNERDILPAPVAYHTARLRAIKPLINNSVNAGVLAGQRLRDGHHAAGCVDEDRPGII